MTSWRPGDDQPIHSRRPMSAPRMSPNREIPSVTYRFVLPTGYHSIRPSTPGCAHTLLKSTPPVLSSTMMLAVPILGTLVVRVTLVGTTPP